MTLPAGVVSVELRGAYIRADGSPPKGRVVFTPVARTDSPSLNLTVAAVPVTVPVDDAGRFTVLVVAGNQLAFEATLYLQVDEYLDKTLRSYTILVPESAAATGLDLADAETLEPVVDMAGYVLLSSVGVAVAPLVDGLVPAEHLPFGAASAEQVVLNAVAAVALSGHRVVTPRPDGTLDYASNAVAAHLHAPLWVTLGAVTAGQPATVLAYGALTESSWAWTPGAPLFLGADGLLTQTPPVAPGALFLAQVGVATGPTSAFFDRQPSISLI